MNFTSDLAVDKTFDELGLNALFEKYNISLEEYATEHKLHHRTRNPISAAAILQFCLMWGTGVYTLRELAALGKALKIFDISDVALLKRLRKAKDFLNALVQDVLTAQISSNGLVEMGKALQLVCVDGSRFRGRLGTYPEGNYILHYGYRLTISDWGASAKTDFFEFTQVSGEGNGESLAREGCRFRKGDIILGDRAYATGRGIKAVLDAGADFILRIGLASLTLSRAPDIKSRVSLAELVKEMELGENEVGEVEVWARMPCRQWKKIRICTLRKTEAEKEEAIETYKKNNKRNKSHQASEEALAMCGFISVVTSIGKERFSAGEILNIYKLRWQVELVFKRFKSIGEMEVLPTSNPISNQVYFLSKMLAFLLAENEMKDPDATFDNLKNDGIDETGINPEDAGPKFDFFWRDFKLGYSNVKTKISLMAKLDSEQQKILHKGFARFDKREKNRKRQKAPESIGWEIYEKMSA